MMKQVARAECGIMRCKNKRKIQAYLDNAGVNGITLAQEIGVSNVTVYRTLNGSLHSPKVFDFLRKIGVPEEYILDPKKMKEVA